MKNLLYKEFSLSVQAMNYLFLAMALMLLIPSYPYGVAFFYQTLGIFFIFLLGNTNNDLFFTMLLPVRKQDVVRARFATVIIFELLQMVVSVPIALLRNRLNGAPNLAGVESQFNSVWGSVCNVRCVQPDLPADVLQNGIQDRHPLPGVRGGDGAGNRGCGSGNQPGSWMEGRLGLDFTSLPAPTVAGYGCWHGGVYGFDGAGV